MDYKTVAAELGRLQRIALGWASAGKMDVIERDLVLSRLKEIYELVLFAEATVAVSGPARYSRTPSDKAAGEIEELGIAPLEESCGTPPSKIHSETESDDARASSFGSDTGRANPAEFLPEPEAPYFKVSASGSADSSFAGRPVEKTVSVGREGASPESMRRRPLDKEALRSLYDGSAPASPAAKTVSESKPAGDAVPSIRWSVGINDRYLLIRDLFGGDAGECDRVMERLDELPDMDSALIFISDNYDWPPDTDGARLMVKLLKARFS